MLETRQLLSLIHIYYMTFYQELQLNQAGSKNLLKKSETVKEKSYHMLVYLVKIAVTTVSYTHLVSRETYKSL